MRPTLRFCLLLTAAFLMGSAALVSAAPPEAALENAVNIPSDISWDGYCDGMHLSAGPSGSIGGTQLGCVTNPIVGAPGHRGGVTIAVNQDGTLYTFVVRPDKTWTVFGLIGGSTIEINNGTWSYGVPTAANAGLRPSTQR